LAFGVGEEVAELSELESVGDDGVRGEAGDGGVREGEAVAAILGDGDLGYSGTFLGVLVPGRGGGRGIFAGLEAEDNVPRGPVGVLLGADGVETGRCGAERAELSSGCSKIISIFNLPSFCVLYAAVEWS
jgi:hypothetical protein